MGYIILEGGAKVASVGGRTTTPKPYPLGNPSSLRDCFFFVRVSHERPTRFVFHLPFFPPAVVAFSKRF
jgi:hypothetical protein